MFNIILSLFWSSMGLSLIGTFASRSWGTGHWNLFENYPQAPDKETLVYIYNGVCNPYKHVDAASDIPTFSDCPTMHGNYFKSFKYGPDDARGYLRYACVNATINEATLKPSSDSFLMVTSCPIEYINTSIPMYEYVTHVFNRSDLPVTSLVTQVTYINRHYAYCHGEIDYALVTWHIEVLCNNNYAYDGQSFVEYVKTKCFTAVALDNYLYPNMRDKCSYENSMAWGNTAIIDTCNVTGLWQQYDSDIDWACRHLNLPFQEFRNVFCYICNPSISSMLKTWTRSRCNLTGLLTTYDYETHVKCVYGDMEPRMSPYKNVHCILCNGIGSSDWDRSFEYGTFSTYSTDARTNTETIQLNIDVGNVTNVTEIIQVIDTYCSRFVKYVSVMPTPASSSSKRSRFTFTRQKETYSDSVLRKMVSVYASICGTASICNKNYSNESNAYSNAAKMRHCSVCACDPLCVIHANESGCCFDRLLEMMPARCIGDDHLPELMPGIHRPSWETSDVPLFSVIDTCTLPNAREVDRRNCEDNTSTSITHQTPILSSRYTGIAYKNIFCAVCNEDSWDSVFVFVAITCNTLLESYKIKTLDNILKLVYNNGCSAKVTLPSDGTVRLCGSPEYQSGNADTTTLSTCNTTGQWHTFDQEVRDTCEDDLKYVEVTDMLESITFHDQPLLRYKNAFCIQCNPVNYSAQSVDVITTCSGINTERFVAACMASPVVDRWWPYKNVYCMSCNMDSVTTKSGGLPSRSGYRSLFSITREELRLFQSELTPKCRNGSYDHVQEMCRPLYCSTERVLENNRCVHLFQQAYGVIYSLTVNLKMYPEYFGETIDVDSVCDAVVGDIAAIAEIPVYTCNISTACNMEYYNASTFADKYKDTHWNTSNKTILHMNPMINLTDETIISVSTQFKINYTLNRTGVETALTNMKSKDYVIYISNNMSVTMTTVDAERLTMESEEVCTYSDYWHTERGHKNITTTGTTVKFALSCPLIQLEAREYTRSQDTHGATTIILLAVNLTLDNAYLLITSTTAGESIRVCESYYMKHVTYSVTNNEDLLEMAYFLFNHSCISLSEICLLLTLVMYGLLPSLRTLPGRNNMSLALSLLFAQISMQIGFALQTNTPICQFLGILIHYFWMTTFCFMNVCSYHMHRVFVAHYLMAQINNSPSLFRKYNLYAYGIPALLVLGVIVSKATVTNGMSIGYGNGMCFIDNLYCLISAFIAPSILMFVSNIFFYALTFYKIKNVSSLQTNRSDKRDLVLYARLCSLTGIAWPLQIVDAALGLSVFSFIITFVNASQGLFIFLSFVCNKRVFRLLKHKFLPKEVIASTHETATTTVPVHK